MASYGEDGVKVENPVFPYKLVFKPTGEFTYPDTYVHTFTDDLTAIPSGSTLWNVYALDQPVELGGEERHIADLVTSSPIVTSKWGDQHFFIRH